MILLREVYLSFGISKIHLGPIDYLKKLNEKKSERTTKYNGLQF